MAQTPSTPLAHDWRDKENYGYTEGLPTLAWAWEFLRRNPKYRAACAEQGEAPPILTDEARAWGLLSFCGARKGRAGSGCLLATQTLSVRIGCRRITDG